MRRHQMLHEKVTAQNISMYITHISVSTPSPWAVAGRHWQLAGIPLYKYQGDLFP